MQRKIAILVMGMTMCLTAGASDWGGVPPAQDDVRAVELKAISNPVAVVTFSEAEFVGQLANGYTSTQYPAPLSFFDSGGSSRLGVGGPGTQMFVDPPGLEGASNENVVIDFSRDVAAVSFGFALSCAPTVSPGITVDLVSSTGVVLDTIAVDGINTGFGFAENEFEANTPFRKLSMTFDTASCSRYFVDNLAFRYTDQSIAIPALGPWAIGLLILLLGGLTAFAYRRRLAH